MENLPLKKDLTAIEVAIMLSKRIIQMKILLSRLKQTKMYMNSIKGVIFHEKDSLNIMINDVEYNIRTTEQTIGNFLKPFFGKDEYNYNGKYSFSARELIEGFATIEKVLVKDALGRVVKGIPQALLLSPYSDESNVVNFTAGSIISFSDHKDVLKQLKSVLTDDEVKSFVKPNYSLICNLETLLKKQTHSNATE